MANLDLSNFIVPMQAQGHEATINVADYPEETIRYWLEYGCRRAYQDGINSVAKALRDAGDEVNGAELFTARDETFKKAAMGQRKSGGSGDGLDEEQRAVVAFVDELIPVKTWKAKIEGWADMSTPERRAAKWGLLAKHPKLGEWKAEVKRRATEVEAIQL